MHKTFADTAAEHIAIAGYNGYQVTIYFFHKTNLQQIYRVDSRFTLILGLHVANERRRYKKRRLSLTGRKPRIGPRILGLCPVNEKRRYKVTTSLIGWAQT